MRSVAYLSLAVFVAGAVGAAGCSSSGNAGSSESNETEVAGPDAATLLGYAKTSADLISGEHAHCNMCHTASRDDVLRWGTSMTNVAEQCFTPKADGSQRTPAELIACMSDNESDPASGYSASHLGLFSAGAELLKNTFASGDPTGARYAKFKAASMPKGGGTAMTAAEFNTVLNWVFNGMPNFNEVFGGPPEPEKCVQNISPALADHTTQMKTQGWGARLTDAATPMYGCTGTDPKTCLADKGAVPAEWVNASVNQKVHLLRELPHTNYWIRSSADGRFVGYGQNTAAGIIDLATANDAPPIKVDALYDPSFLPNNDGVSFAGTGTTGEQGGPIRVCKQSVLTAAASQSNPHITLTEAGCTAIESAVYQSVGAALDGSVSWMSFGTHVNDDGGNITTAPMEGFEENATTSLVPMVSDGVSYQPKPTVTLATPLEGDQMFSPSSTLLLTRGGSKPDTKQYKIRKLTTTNTGGTIGATTEVIGTLCGGGGKAMVSFDERYVVTHEYVDPAEQPATGGLPSQSSNIVVWDLKTGEKLRLTNMPANQYALYPHFRADGWMYFMVRDLTSPTGKHTLVATDFALNRP